MLATESTITVPRFQVDLSDFIDWSGVECLNQNPSYPLANALKQDCREDEGLNLESCADEQLLIHIPFTQVIKLHSIAIKGSEEEGPKMVKLFSNKKHMGFSNVDDFFPTHTVVLTPDDLKGKPVFLKYVKFQNVRSLTIFIEDNQSGSAITKIQKIALYGSTPYLPFIHQYWRRSTISSTSTSSIQDRLGRVLESKKKVEGTEDH